MLVLTDDKPSRTLLQLSLLSSALDPPPPHRRGKRLASLFMSVPNILISVNHPDPPPSSISQAELCHYFQCLMHFFCRMFSLFLRF